MHIQIQIQLVDAKPQVARTLLVPAEISLDDLHLIIQSAMGWKNAQAYEFRSEELTWVPSCDASGGYGEEIAEGVMLYDVVALWRLGDVSYTYDFRDMWIHALTIVDTFETLPESQTALLMDGTGLCPPESSGGPYRLGETCRLVRAQHHHRRRKEFLLYTILRHDEEFISFTIAELATKVAEASVFSWKRRNLAENKKQAQTA